MKYFLHHKILIHINECESQTEFSKKKLPVITRLFIYDIKITYNYKVKTNVLLQIGVWCLENDHSSTFQIKAGS